MRRRGPGAAHAALEHGRHVELLADARRSSRRPLNAKHDVRAATRSPSICESAFRISSVMPSAKYSSSGAAQVLEWQHRDRLLARRRRRFRRRRPRPRPARAARRRCRAAARRRPCAGSVAGARARAAASGRAARVQSGSRSRMRAIRSDTVSPANAGRPVEALEQHAAERPDVGAPVDRRAARLLGAHVGRGAEDHARAGSRRRVMVGEFDEVGVEPASDRIALGEAEVEHLHRARGREHDVAGLEIAVDDAALVRRLDRRGDLDRRRRAPRATASAPRASRCASVSPSTNSSTR